MIIIGNERSGMKLKCLLRYRIYRTNSKTLNRSRNQYIEASVLTIPEPEPVYVHWITGAKASLLTIQEPEPAYVYIG